MFVEFFVNDMLDYAVLQNSEAGFIKQIACFDIREGIQEILNILERKIQIKKLTIEQEFENFQLEDGKENYIVKTDCKRFQQVLLNLISNAIKFSNFNGLIIIRIK